MRRGRSGKSLDLDDDIEEDTMEALRRLLRPSDLSRLRDRILTDNKRTGRKKPNRSDRKRPKRRQQSKESAERLRQSKEVPRKKVIKDKIRTILEPGQLQKIRETGTFDWNAKRIKRYEAVDPEEKEEDYEEEEEEFFYDELEEDVEHQDSSLTDSKSEKKEERRKQILSLVEKLLNVK